MPTGGQENTGLGHYDYYEDSFEDEDSQAADCQLDTSGKAVFTSAMVSLQLADHRMIRGLCPPN